MKKNSLDRYLPFWTTRINHRLVFLGCTAVTAIACTYLYFCKLLVARDCQIMIMDDPAFADELMPDFADLLGSRFWFPSWRILYSDKPVFMPVLLLVLVAIGFAIYHYVTLRQGAKSNYLMGRLPDKKELHRRCLTFPLLMVLAGGGAAAHFLRGLPFGHPRRDHATGPAGQAVAELPQHFLPLLYSLRPCQLTERMDQPCWNYAISPNPTPAKRTPCTTSP